MNELVKYYFNQIKDFMSNQKSYEFNKINKFFIKVNRETYLSSNNNNKNIIRKIEFNGKKLYPSF